MSRFIKFCAVLDEAHRFNRDGFWTTVPLEVEKKEFQNAEAVARHFGTTTLNVYMALKTGTLQGRPIAVSTSFLDEIGVRPEWLQ